MFASRLSQLIGTGVLIVVVSISLARAEVSFTIVAKESSYLQEGPTVGDVIPDEDPFYFIAFVGVESQSDLTSATVQRAGSVAEILIFDQDEQYALDLSFGSLAELEAAYPPGDYTITYTPAGGSAVSRTLSLTGVFPQPPLLENWFDLQHVVADQDLTIRLGEFVGGTAADMILVEIYDADTDDSVFETGIHYFGEDNALDGTARSVTLSAGTLTAGRSYEVNILFFDMEVVQQAAGFSASFHQTAVRSRLRTVSGHPGTVVDSGIIGRWSAHRQTGPDTINPLSGQGSAWVFASIWMDDNRDLNSARLDSQHNLVLSSDTQEGWSFLHTLSSIQELLAWLPNGEHTLDYEFAAGGSHQTFLTLSGDLPDPVRISNWDELQSVSADAATTIRWDDPGNVREFDGFIVTVYETDGSGDTVLETDLDLDTMTGLFGPVTSFEVPAGTLENGKVYAATLNFMRFTDIDDQSQAGAWFVAANGVETQFTINTGATGATDPVEIGGVGRDVYYLQTSPAEPILHPDDPDQFMSFGVLVGESAHELVSASVTLPGGAVRTLQYDAGDGEWISETHNASLDALLADFADGDYTLGYTVSGGSKEEVVVTLGSTFPGVPHVTNWTEAQSVMASDDFTLTWAPIENMTGVDAIMIYIDDAQGDGVYYDIPPYFVDEAGLRGTAVSATIPAGTLEANRTYDVEINALHFTDFDDSREGQIFGAFNLSNTLLQLVTTDGNQSPVITTESLDDAHEGQAYAITIRASDPDGFEVDLRAPVLPGWLTFDDQGGGEGVLSGTPSTAHVGAFTVSVEATDGQGKTKTRAFTLNVQPDLSDPEGRALDITGVSWVRDLASPFAPQIEEVQYGESALVSGSVGDGATSFLRGTFDGPIDLSFHWKVSSQAGHDFFRVSVDDSVEAEISGEQNWRRQVVSLPAGTHSVVWSYEKDGADSSGLDRGWLDHVAILPAQSSLYSGIYMGGIDSSSGTVAFYVRPDRTAVFLGYHPESGNGLSNASVDVSGTNSFSFNVANPDDPNENFVVSGSITHLLVGGTVSGLDLSFSATRVTDEGDWITYNGYYENAMLATSGRVRLIVAPDGQTYLFAENGPYVEGHVATIDAEGRIALTTDQGYVFDLQIDPASNRVTGSCTPPVGEVYAIRGLRDGSPADERLANISTRGQVLEGDKVMIASFVITGNGSKRLLIRAVGPTLGDFGVTGVLADPSIELIRLGASDPMSINDNWSDDANQALVESESTRLGAFALTQGGLDAVMLISLEPGAYTTTVRGQAGLTGVGLVEVYDADDLSESRSTADVVNIATRGEVGTGADVLIAGFVVSGDMPKRVLVRGVGPQLGVYGVVGVLEDPNIELVRGQEIVATNDDWGDAEDAIAVARAAGEVGAFALEADSKDAALLIWLEPGAYTAKVSGGDGGTGVALIEVYDN